ncbi:type II toxin-antitoxin system MqsA family antitoxin [bacterium]|nr:type II toxin-antitoxin system MqsA family antitoxin [bacterium]
MNKCVFCGGPVKSKNVTFNYEHNDQMVLIKNVPAEVCLHCGEQMYSPETTDQIISISKSPKKPVKTIKVPLYDFQLEKNVA